MWLCDWLNRAAGLKGWEDLIDSDHATRYELEDLYFAQLERHDLSKVTSLAMVDNIRSSDNILSEEDLRAQIFDWSSLPEVEYVFDPQSGKEQARVVLTNLNYGQSNRASEEKLERERPRDVSTEGRAAVAKVGSVKRFVPLNCGVSDGRRRRKLKSVESRAQKERKRKRKRREELKSEKSRGSKSRTSGNCLETVVDTFNGRGKRVSKASVDTARVKLLGDNYDPRAHHGVGQVDRPIQKLLLSAGIGIQKKCHHPKSYEELSKEKKSAEPQSRQERMKWNSGWRKATMYAAGVQRKMKLAGAVKKPAQSNAFSTGDKKESKGADTEKGLGSAKRDSDSGDKVIDSVSEGGESKVVCADVLSDLIGNVMTRESNGGMNVGDEELGALTDSEDEEGDEGEDGNVSIACVSEGGESKAVFADVLSDLIGNVMTRESNGGFLPKMTDGALADDEDEEEVDESREEGENKKKKESAGEHDLVVNEIETESTLRLRGGGDVWLTEEFDTFEREDVIECLIHLNVRPDYSQTTEKLKKQLQQKQISDFIGEQTPSTILHVLKKYSLPWKKKDRREAKLKMHFLRNPDLQQRILDDIAACSVMSPISSEAESDGTPKISSPPSASEFISSPATPSTASPIMPGTVSPATPGQASKDPDRLWTMSTAELMSFLKEAQVDAPPRQRTEYYRDKVGIIMVDRLLKKLNDIDAVTEVLEKLQIEYDPHITRRVGNLRSHFVKKEAGKEEMLRKQMAVLRELQLAVARSKGGIFTFPSEYNPSDFATPSLPTTSHAHLSQQSELQPPPAKRMRKQPPDPSRDRDSSTADLHTAHTAPGPALHTVDLRAHDEQAGQATQVMFENPSTHCYINGLLNLLFSNPDFMRVLFSAGTEQQLSGKHNGSVNILHELRRLSQIPVTGDMLLGNGVPGECGNVAYLKQLLGNQWAGDTQEDAHDLFTELYTRLSCPAIEKLFEVVYQINRQCLRRECQPVTNQDTSECLLLVPQGNMSMLDIYRSLSANEVIPFNCECGSDRNNSQRVLAFTGTSMVVVLKRYDFNAAGTIRMDNSIAVPLSMVVNEKTWHLTGALKNTSGNDSTASGHYTGIRRDLVTGHFFRNNDNAPLERLYTQEALHFINKSYMFMYCSEEALPGGRAPPIPVEEGPGGDRPAVTGAHVPARKVHRVDGAGDHAATTELNDPSVNLGSTSARGTSAPPAAARKKTTGARKTQKGAQVKQLADDFHPPEEEMAEMREYARLRRVHLEERHARLQRNDFSWQGLPPNPLYENILRMEAELNNFKSVQCSHCKEVLFGEKLTKDKMCQRCHTDDKRRAREEVRMWSAENNMHPEVDVPDALKNLTPVEQSAIQRMFVVMKIYRLARGATFLKGHCLAVNQDLAEFATRLPLRPADLPMIFLIGPNQRVPLKANAHKILAALEYLKKENEFYRDIEIDFEALKAYPSNDTDDVQGLCTIESETVDEEADPADAYTGEEGADVVYTSIQGTIPHASVKEEIKRYVLSEDEADIPKVEWPRREKKPADENTRGAFTMMFPWLFPTGAGDYTVMGPAGRPQYLAWLRHLLNHKSRRFSHDRRFIHYGSNRHQKVQARTLGHCFVNYRETDITLQKLKEQVANDNLSIFSSLLYFARNIVGSRQFFRYEGKKSLSLINFIHIMSDMKETMNLFVTLSFADQHDPALHQLFQESHRYLGKTVVSSLADIPEDGLLDDYILASEDHRLRTEAVEKNGDIVCQYLDKKLWLFFEHVLKPMGVIDYILRVEFQYRSSEHFHMVLRLLDGVPVDEVHRAFTLSEFEVKGIEKVDKLAPEEQDRIGQDHERVLASRTRVADFSTFRLGQTAIHPQKDPKQWPGKEGLNIQRPRVNCLRRQFSDVVADPNKPITFQFQAPRGRKGKQLAKPRENILADEATAQRIIDDAILMVNRLQLHNCTKRYCLKIVVAAILLCKFHFPMELEGFTSEQIGELYDKVHNYMADHPGAVFKGDDLVLARNHPRLVVTISELILGWRGNTNTRFVQSVHQLIEYLLKYILKVTAGSKSFANTVKDITNQTDDDAKVSSVFQKLLMRNITEHDLSRTEAFRIALGKALVYYSRKFKPVNLNGLRMVVKDHEGDGEPGADRKAKIENKADLYWRRDNDSNFADLVQQYEAEAIVLPCHPREINLYHYVASFESNWTPSRETYVPLPSPLHKYPPDPREPKAAENRKDYLRAQLLLFEPGARPCKLPTDLEGLEAKMRDFVQTIHCPRLIREAFWKSWEKKDTDAVEPRSDPLLEDPELPDEADIEQDPFMAGLGATLTKADRNNVNLIDEEEEDADGLMLEHGPVVYTGIATDMDADWDRGRMLLGLDRRQVAEAPQWLESQKAVTEIPNQEWTEQFEPDALNSKQREVYNLMEGLVMGDKVEPGVHLIDVSGEAGTGKSRLIKTILYQSEMRSGKRSRIRVCAFTNSAARQFVGGKTAHRLFRLDVERGRKGTRCRHQPPLEGKRLMDFQAEFEDTWAIIIDEKSMIGCFDLWRIDQRLRQARPHHADQMFGGLVVLLCGDLSQLPPVGDKPLYYDGNGELTKAQSQGRSLYAQFKDCYFLTESMRQQGAENELFRSELRRLANGTITIEDWYRWEKRSFVRLSEEEQIRFHTEGVKLCGRNVDKVAFNEDGIKRCNTPILVVEAENNNSTAKKASDTDAELPNYVPVATGAAVVLTDNLWPDMGLINGSKGNVTHIVFEEGKNPANSMPAFIVVCFPDYLGPPFVPGCPGTVPVCPRTAEWKEGTLKCTRRSFPLIPGYALTIHKSQGMTIDQPVVIDIGAKEFSGGLTYTVCTRTRSLENVAFHPMPTFNRIRDIFKESFRSKQLEVTRRMGLAAEREARAAAAARNSSAPTGGEVEPVLPPADTVPPVVVSVDSSPADPIVIDDFAPDDPAGGQPLVAGQVCSYPVGERTVNHVFVRDYRKLGRNQKLNDVLIKLGLDYFERQLLSTAQRARLHVFNSGRFSRFMLGLTEDQFASAPSDALARAMHARVARLTSRPFIDLFTKDIVLWPIEHSDHWYLVVGLNLGKPNSVIFTVNSIGNYGEGAILEHIKAYLALEYQTLPSRGGQLPAVQTLATSPPQQTGNIDCGLYIVGYAEAIFRRFDQFSGLPGSEALRENWFPSFSPLHMRQRLADIIRNLSVQQNFGVASWPELDLS